MLGSPKGCATFWIYSKNGTIPSGNGSHFKGLKGGFFPQTLIHNPDMFVNPNLGGVGMCLGGGQTTVTYDDVYFATDRRPESPIHYVFRIDPTPPSPFVGVL